MPSKKKKKKKKQDKPQPVEFALNFTDITMVESEGEYDIVKRLVEEDLGPHHWNIKTNLVIESPFGVGMLELDLRHDRSIYIIGYQASTGNIYYNPDLSALMRWSQIAGWKIPQPSEELIRSNLSFWRHMWETLIIDSDLLDERYGIRKSLDIRDLPKTEMELAEEAEEAEALDESSKAQRRAEWKSQIGAEKPSAGA